jgi:predicted secreted protein
MPRSKYSLLVALTIIFALVSGCGQQNQNTSEQPTPKEVQLTEQGGACGHALGLDSGDTLVLVLDREPDSEYQWEVGFYVPEVIQPEDDTAAQSASNMASETSTQTLRFLAMGEGQATLVLVYHNPLEEDAPDLKTCEVTVEIK